MCKLFSLRLVIKQVYLSSVKITRQLIGKNIYRIIKNYGIDSGNNEIILDDGEKRCEGITLEYNIDLKKVICDDGILITTLKKRER